VNEDDAFYHRALLRVDRLSYVLAVILVVGAFAFRGRSWALGSAIGAAVSCLNLWLWKRVARSIGTEGSRPSGASATMLGLRYLLMAGAIFVIIKYFEVSLLAVLAGLLVSVAAVILEIVYELVFTSHKA